MCVCVWEREKYLRVWGLTIMAQKENQWNLDYDSSIYLFDIG